MIITRDWLRDEISESGQVGGRYLAQPVNYKLRFIRVMRCIQSIITSVIIHLRILISTWSIKCLSVIKLTTSAFPDVTLCTGPPSGIISSSIRLNKKCDFSIDLLFDVFLCKLQVELVMLNLRMH